MIARLFVFLAVFFFAATAQAERCGADARAWVDRCSKSTGVTFSLAACPASLAILSTPDVRIELSTSDKAFEYVNGYGLSPIGDFPDWQKEPEPRRHALAALHQCVKAEAPAALLGDEAAPEPPRPGVPRVREPLRKTPWLLLAGVLLSLGATVRRARPALAAVVAVAVVFFLRQLMQPWAYFHQNGQGPVWLGFAYNGDSIEYGPGYAEVFAWVARGARPEHGLLLLQGILAATIPLSVYVIARACGAARSTAMVFGAAMAFDPVLARVGRSESYFSLMAALLFGATAVLASGSRLRSQACRWAALLGAALLVAQAARVHPVAWAPAALVPLVLLCRPGRPRDRWRRTAIAALVIGVVAAPLVLPSMRATLHSDLGRFAYGARSLLGNVRVPVAIAVALASAFAWFVPRVGIRAWVLVVAVGVTVATNVLANDAKVVHAAHLHLYLPAMIAAVSVAQPALALSAIAMVHVVTERPLRALPTDALELQWATEWREQLPRDAKVAALQRVDDRLLILPLVGNDLPQAVSLDDGSAAYYYRSSLCFTPEGAPACVTFESTHKLKPLGARRMPSIASLPWAPMPEGEIEVALFQVE